MWIVSQIGAREHYAIPRALLRAGELGLLCTDAWIRPGSAWGCLPGSRRLQDRFHAELADGPVFAPTARMLVFEMQQRLCRRTGWDAMIARNDLYQKLTIRRLSCYLGTSDTQRNVLGTANPSSPTLFSYSYAALELFRFAKSQGWRTVLGQIDPGPEEERLVLEECRRYPQLKTAWKPTPPAYWENWREEIALADRIIVNSAWSRQCLAKLSVPEEKMEVVPLVYEGSEKQLAIGATAGSGDGQPSKARQVPDTGKRIEDGRNKVKSTVHSAAKSMGRGPWDKGRERLAVLFLGMINLRKGVGRLLEAMRELQDETIQLTLAGPSDMDPAAWADLPNVKWVGPVPRSEVGRYYVEADLFILPTISDGYALTQLEALSRGLPVLASKSCGAAVTHGVNGWILDDLEPATIANAIRKARKALPLKSVAMPPFTLDDLAQKLISG